MDQRRKVVLAPGIAIDPSELRVTATRAGGPGGQHVNRSASRVELRWDILTSPSLDPDVRRNLLGRLASRIDSRGVLRIVSAETRSQHRNRQRALERLRALVAEATYRPPPRHATKPSRASRERRLEEKRRRGMLKRSRRPPGEE